MSTDSQETQQEMQKVPNRAQALITRATSIEKIIYASIGRAIMRRPVVARGAKGFYYHAPTITLLTVFIVLSTLEIFIVDLIVHKWIWVRIPLLVLGIWGVVWMIGMLCAHFMRPHTVGTEGIRVRNGLDWDVHVTWDDVYSVELKKRTYEPKTPKVFEEDDKRTLTYQVGSETNVEIILERPTNVTLPGVAPRGGEQVVDRICLWTDNPRGFLDAARDMPIDGTEG